jgi:hypothetical protein
MSVPLDCPPGDAWQALLDAGLPPDERERYERHLQSCPSCQQRIDEGEEGGAELQRLGRQMGDPTIFPPAWLENLVARLLAKDPVDRFQSAAEVAELLEGYMAHLRQPAAVPAPSLPPPPADHEHRAPAVRSRAGGWAWCSRPLGLTALLTLALLGIAALTWLAGAGGAGPEAEAKGDAAPALRATFRQDFRSANPDNPLLRVIGEGVRWEPEGVRIVLPAGREMPAAGLVAEFRVRGDFEITVSYAILNADRPATGFGVGANLYARIDPNANDAVSLARRVLTDGTTVFLSDRLLPVAGEVRHRVKTVPSTSPAGKLRLRRTGSLVQFLTAEGDDPEFRRVDETEFGTADLCYLQFGGNTGGSRAGLDLRLLDFTVRAEELPGVPEPSPDQAADPAQAGGQAGGKGRLVVSLLVGLAVAGSLAVGAWLYLRRIRRATGEQPADSGPAPPPVIFSCANCGKTLRVRADLAGKKLECPHCGQRAC